jgi:diguanylate cyclase (GGDEF)-like protein
LSIFSLVTKSSAVTPVHRKSLFLFAVACAIPLVSSIAYNLGYGSSTISIVPIVFSILLPLYAWLIINEQLVDFSPVAYETVFQHMQDPVIVLDDQQRVIGLNHGAEALLSVSEAVALRKTLAMLFPGDMPEIQQALDTGLPQKLLTSTGRFLHVQVSPISSRAGAMKSGRVLMFRDVSDVENAQKEVRSSEMLLRTLVDHSADGILRLRWDTVNGGRTLSCIFANTAAGRFLHMNPNDLIGWSGEDLIAEFSSGTDAADQRGLIADFRSAAAAGNKFETEFMLDNKTEKRCLQLICEPVGWDIAVTLIDITDRKAREEQMESIALSDPLTGALNRRGFEDRASARLLVSDDLAEGALLFVDLNGFKKINDDFGHETGDELLKHVTARLKKRLRPSDIIARLGGDEFVALVPDADAEVAAALAERLAESLAEPYQIAGETLHCPASIGLALYPENSNTLTGLLRSADQAMYRAKARCRATAAPQPAAMLEKAS